MGRPDPVLTLFRTQNFMPLLLPRADLLPLQLVGVFGKSLSPLGAMSTSFNVPPGVGLPPVISDIATAASLEGKTSSQVKLSIGLEILGSILKALSGRSLELSAAYRKAKTITFKFTEVSADKIEINTLDQYLGQASINPSAVHIEKMMIDDQVGVLTMTLKSKKFVIAARSEGGSHLGVSVPDIQGIVGGSVKVEPQCNSGTEIAYSGDVPVTFAAQGVRLFFDDDGHYTAFDPFKVGQYAVRGASYCGVDVSSFEPEMLSVGAGFARVVARR